MRYLIHRLKTDRTFRKRAIHSVLDHVQFILTTTIVAGCILLLIKNLGQN